MTNEPANGITDLHSHLVPGVDDGAPTLEDALEGVDRMVKRGVSHIVTTPHLNASLSWEGGAMTEVLDRMDEAFEPVRDAVLARYPHLVFERSHEVMLDVPDPDLSDPRLSYPGTNVILMEWPGLQLPPGTPRVLGELREAGIQPLIAHPERYRGLETSMDIVERWRDEGAWFIVNHGSLVGRYGNDAQRNAERLLARGWVDAMATDFHGRPRLSLFIEQARSWFEERDLQGIWHQLSVENPLRIVRGEAPAPVPAVAPQETFFGRLRSALGGGSR